MHPHGVECGSDGQEQRLWMHDQEGAQILLEMAQVQDLNCCGLGPNSQWHKQLLAIWSRLQPSWLCVPSILPAAHHDSDSSSSV